MENEIFTVSIGSNSLDNDYIFFDDGRIKHFFDRHMYKLNQEHWIKADEISNRDKEKLFNKCSEEQLEILKNRFNLA